MKRYRHIFLALIGVFGILSTAAAQPATPAQRAGVEEKPGYATLHMHTNVGSFKIIDAVGRVEFTFTGTVLISGYEGAPPIITGKVRKEHEVGGRAVYNGTGKVVLVGKWRGVQWFGKKMEGVWFGTGVIRVQGEYDKDLKTGELWYDDPKTLIYWPAQGTMDHQLPPRQIPGSSTVTPQPKKKGS